MKSIRLLGATLLASTTLLGAASAFAEVSQPATPDPATAQTPINAQLTLDENPGQPEPPKEPEGGTDEGTGIEGLFGIAYAPAALSGQKQLEDTGDTVVELSNNTNTTGKYNVGVQDKTRAKDRNWKLTAQLEWSGTELEGATITASNGIVKLNDGKGSLTELKDSEVLTTASSLTISKEATTDIMTAQKGKVLNGVYNYQFSNPKLTVPNSENVAAGTYSGNINWNLSNVVE